MEEIGLTEKYYATFDEMTGGGRFFVDGLSELVVKESERKLLGNDEIDSRMKYQKAITDLIDVYDEDTITHPIATTKEQVLQQRVVAPILTTKGVSSRHKASESKASRVYPPEIYVWTEFQAAVQSFHLDDCNKNSDTSFKPIKSIFYDSLKRAEVACCDEGEEQRNLIENLHILEKGGIILSIARRDNMPVQGLVDFCILRDENSASIICETKSTNNLLLPMSADECKRTYDAVYSYVTQNKKRSAAWANVAHPIGQLLGYMVNNQHCYGALTSATKTYFVKIQNTKECSTDVDTDGDTDGHSLKCNEVHQDAMYQRNVGSDTKRLKSDTGIDVSSPGMNRSSGEACVDQDQNDCISDKTDHGNTTPLKNSGSNAVKVYISNAWCVGEENYLRAWAYMHTLHNPTYPWIEPEGWIQSTTKVTTPNALEQGQAASGSNGSSEAESHETIEEGKSMSPNSVSDANPDHHCAATKGCNLDHYYNTILQGVLHVVPYDEIVFLGILGYGRNGACFKARWNGRTECAVKVFDIGRVGDTYFVKEIQAYVLLQKAWGILVPRPLFISESFSGGLLYLGLQLGRESTSDDDLPKFEDVLNKLEKEYGIRHNDAVNGRNMIVITDDSGDDRVVAMDFEDWEFL